MTNQIWLVVLAFVISSQAIAVNKIIEIDEESSDVLALYLDSGEIVEINRANSRAIDIARDAFFTKDSINILTKDTFEVSPSVVHELEIVPSETPYTPMARNNKNMFSRDEYRDIDFRTLDPLEKSNISVLPSYDTAQAIMDNINGGTDDKSECYNRAHMWTYEALIKDNVNLGKIWIFFGKKYIKEFGHKWWFHVAPYTHVNDNNVRYVLDRGFHTVPNNVRNWTDFFIKNRAECRVVTDYQVYEDSNKRKQEYCYLIYSSQYYWQPWQVEKLSKKRTPFWGYKEFELKIAYPDALIRGTWNRVIPALNSRVHTGTRFPVSVDGRLEDGRTSNPQDAERERREREERERRERENPAPERNGVPYINVQYSRGDDVIDNNMRTGEIENILSDGRVVVDYDNSGQDSIKDVREIGKRLSNRVFGLAEGDRIVIAGRSTGKIERLYSNGIFKVDIDDQRSDSYVRFSQGVANEVRSMGGFSRGMKVVDVNGNEGEVDRVYANGLALVDFKRYDETVVDISNLRRI